MRLGEPREKAQNAATKRVLYGTCTFSTAFLSRYSTLRDYGYRMIKQSETSGEASHKKKLKKKKKYL